MTIEYGKLSDREILVLTAQHCNEMVKHLEQLNDKIAKHEKRLTVLEVEHAYGLKRFGLAKKEAVGYGSLLIAIGSVVGAIVAKIIEVVG